MILKAAVLQNTAAFLWMKIRAVSYSRQLKVFSSKLYDYCFEMKFP
jgi:hypothetical protein